MQNIDNVAMITINNGFFVVFLLFFEAGQCGIPVHCFSKKTVIVTFYQDNEYMAYQEWLFITRISAVADN